MPQGIPPDARPVARVLLLDERGRLFLLRALDPVNGQTWWVTPGGGLEEGETFEDAARRELLEETGLDVAIGPWVWTRRHAYEWNGRWCDQYERFFVAVTPPCEICPQKEDDYVVEKRWWTLQELQHSRDDFAPRQLRALILPILDSKYPSDAIDCGI